MALRSRFNTVDTFNCEDIINEQKLCYSNNICFKNSFKVSQTAVASMNLNVALGNAKIRGAGVVSDSVETVIIETNSSIYARYDLVVLELNNVTFEVSLKVLKGVAALEPQVPATTIYQYPLAKVYISPGATSILDNSITDLRNVFNADSLEDFLLNTVYKELKSNTDKVSIVEKAVNAGINFKSDRIKGATSQIIEYINTKGYEYLEWDFACNNKTNVAPVYLQINATGGGFNKAIKCGGTLHSKVIAQKIDDNRWVVDWHINAGSGGLQSAIFVIGTYEITSLMLHNGGTGNYFSAVSSRVIMR